jgi:hypothetical protein
LAQVDELQVLKSKHRVRPVRQAAKQGPRDKVQCIIYRQCISAV